MADDDLIVPFIGSWQQDDIRAEFAEKLNVENMQLMSKGWDDVRGGRMPSDEVGAEADVGIWNTVPAALSEALSNSRRAVARIIAPPGEGLINYRGEEKPNGWCGTGFLVARNILLTNHHVINSKDVGQISYAEFHYEHKISHSNMIARSEPSTIKAHFDPSRLFVTSSASETGLDYTFVWIDLDDEQFATCSTIKLERGSFTARDYEPTFIIHHPRGALKQLSLDDTEILGDRPTALLYAADTRKGSSGAPVLNKFGRLIACIMPISGVINLEISIRTFARRCGTKAHSM